MKGHQVFPIVIFRIEMDTLDGESHGMDIEYIYVRVASQDLAQVQVITPVIARRGDGQTGISNQPAAVVRETGQAIGSIVVEAIYYRS